VAARRPEKWGKGIRLSIKTLNPKEETQMRNYVP
jgi:hypothetical protein